MQLESSGPTFRGLAVQVREATESATFSNDAAFVGQFVNPPADGDWRIWDCDAVSHSSIIITADRLIATVMDWATADLGIECMAAATLHYTVRGKLFPYRQSPVAHFLRTV